MATLIVIVAITVGVGALIMTTMYNSDSISPEATYNETITSWANNTAEDLTFARATSITSIGNTTNTIAATNYALASDEDSSTVTMIYGDSGWLAGDYWVYYTYRTESVASDALEMGNASLGVFGDWLVIIAIVIVAVVVLALIKYL